jgi:hypothetical protein
VLKLTRQALVVKTMLQNDFGEPVRFGLVSIECRFPRFSRPLLPFDSFLFVGGGSYANLRHVYDKDHEHAVYKTSPRY